MIKIPECHDGLVMDVKKNNKDITVRIELDVRPISYKPILEIYLKNCKNISETYEFLKKNLNQDIFSLKFNKDNKTLKLVISRKKLIKILIIADKIIFKRDKYTYNELEEKFKVYYEYNNDLMKRIDNLKVNK